MKDQILRWQTPVYAGPTPLTTRASKVWQEDRPSVSSHTSFHTLVQSLVRHVSSAKDCELLEGRDGLLDVTVGYTSVTEFTGCKTEVWR